MVYIRILQLNFLEIYSSFELMRQLLYNIHVHWGCSETDNMQKYFFYWLKDDGYQQKICQIYLKHLYNIFGHKLSIKKNQFSFFFNLNNFLPIYNAIIFYMRCIQTENGNDHSALIDFLVVRAIWLSDLFL